MARAGCLACSSWLPAPVARRCSTQPAAAPASSLSPAAAPLRRLPPARCPPASQRQRRPALRQARQLYSRTLPALVSAAAVSGAAAAASQGTAECSAPAQEAETESDAAAAAASRPAEAAQPIDPEQLDWKLGVTLAHASFEAYNELDEQGLAEKHACGAEVYFVDREFVREKLAGLLQVTVRRACSPVAAEATSHPLLSTEPLLHLAVGESTWVSSPAAVNSLDPEWQESCTLFIRDPASQSLRLEILGPDGQQGERLGCAAQPLAGLCDGRTHHLSLQLECTTSACTNRADAEHGSPASSGSDDSGSPAGAAEGAGEEEGQSSEEVLCGSVQLSARFLSFEEAAAQEAAADSEMGGPVVGTPGEIPLAADWRALLEMAGVEPHAMLRPVAFIEHTTTSSEAWVYWNPEAGMACVAFRGTEQGKFRDIITDLHLVPAPLDPDRVAAAPRHAALGAVSQPPEQPGTLTRILDTVKEATEQVAAERAQAAEESGSKEKAEQHIVATAISTVKSTAEELSAVLDRVKEEVEAAGRQEEEDEREGREQQPWVHQGFLTAYDSIRPALLSLLSLILEQPPAGAVQQAEGAGGEEQQEEPRGWRLALTGHSLGGALATLAAWDIAHREWGPCPPALKVVTFGSPRVGNRAWADSYNRAVPDTWRVVNDQDAVCTVPRLMGYAHVGHAIYLSSQGDGTMQVVMHSTQQLGEGLSVSSLAPAVRTAMQASVADVAEKVPEMLPEVAASALKLVGIEVATAGDEEAASAAKAAAARQAAAGSAGQVEDGGASAAGSPGPASSAAAAAAVAEITPDHLPDIWEQERAAWSMLLDVGTGLEHHMEDTYLLHLKHFLQRRAQQQQQGEGHTGQPGEGQRQQGQQAEGQGQHGAGERQGS